MTPKAYLAISIFSSVFTLSACQTALQSVTANQQAPIVAPVVPAILDSDGDGVLDNIDECPETPPNVVVDAKGCEIIIEGGEALEMELRGFFAPLSSRLINTYDKEFAKIEEKLKEHPDANVFIFGHLSSNELALSETNDNLSRQRALTIKNRLITEHHIASDRITTYDCLDQYPSTNIDQSYDDPEQIESKNRRVVLKASRQVKNLSNLKYASYTESYGKYAKHCELFE
ncbi:OmpA family protein [Psychrobacter submarinus]|uniref:OmpA family protein n=1 Tax=Psychrobacter submarinus TaxID=154108 RepID=UPI001919187D|nr:OmpA family protein [Psychrobacter submarinus]